MRSGDGQSRVLSHLAGAGEAGREGAAKLRVFLVISVTYILFWGPLFTVTLVNWSWEWKDAKNSLSHEVSCCSASAVLQCWCCLGIRTSSRTFSWLKAPTRAFSSI